MILIGLGANLDGVYGTPELCIKSAISFLEKHGVSVRDVSHIWKTAPVPVSDQPWYRNAVCSVDTSLNSYDLLAVLASIEDKAGRKRREQNEARVLDLDLLAYNDEVINDDILSLPHPRMNERAFVLYPLLEIAPNWVHPKLNKSVSDLIKDIPLNQEIERIENSGFSRDGLC